MSKATPATTISWIGIDVSKDKLDVYCLATQATVNTATMNRGLLR